MINDNELEIYEAEVTTLSHCLEPGISILIDQELGFHWQTLDSGLELLFGDLPKNYINSY